MSAEILSPDSFSLTPPPKPSLLSWFWNLFAHGSPEHTIPITIPKYPAEPDEINLATALQYSMATFTPKLQEFLQEFIGKVYKPAYEDFTILADVGNTDGYVPRFSVPWSFLILHNYSIYRTMVTFCNPGEGILIGEWTYPSALASMRPYGITPVPIAIDAQGLKSDDLRKVLSEWDDAVMGMPR
jgi:aromatic amino acid aminotransferase I